MLVVLGLSILVLICGEPLIHPEASWGIVSFELVWTLEGLARVMDPWTPAIIARTIEITWLDFVYLVSYGTLLAAAALWVHKTMGRWFAWLAWIAAGCDAFENLAGLRLLYGPPTDPWPFVMSCFATVKFVLLALISPYLLIGGLIWIGQRIKK